MGVGVVVGEMTRGVLGTWYCCDIVNVALKEWNGGRAEDMLKRKEQDRRKGYVRLVVEWSLVFDCFSFAIVTVTGAYSPSTSDLIAEDDMAR